MEPTSVIGTKNKKGQVFTDPRIMMREAPRTPSFYTGSEVIKEAIRLANPWAPQILALLGLFDNWFDFRRWAEPPPERSA